MKTILKIPDLRNEVNTALTQSLNNLLDIRKIGMPFTTEIQKKLNKKELSFCIISKEVFKFIDLHFDFNRFYTNKGLAAEHAINGCIEKDNEQILHDSRNQFISNYNNEIIRKIDYHNLEIFSFDYKNRFLNTLDLVHVFIKCIQPYQYEKFKYFVDEVSIKKSNNFKVNFDTCFDIYDAFPEANLKFGNFLENRVNLFYINYAIDKVNEFEIKKNKNQEEVKKDKGNYDLFKPESDFSKIFNDQDEFPKFIYDYLKSKNKKFFSQANLNRLRNILQHSKFKNQVIIKNNEESHVTFTIVTGQFIGKKYSYKDESSNKTNLLDEIALELKKMSDDKGLIIKYQYT